MEMPRDMKWGKTEDFRNLSLVGKTYRHRTYDAQASIDVSKDVAVKRKVEANDMADKRPPSQEHPMMCLSGNREPVPCFRCASEPVFVAKRQFRNFLINVCPC